MSDQGLSNLNSLEREDIMSHGLELLLDYNEGRHYKDKYQASGSAATIHLETLGMSMLSINLNSYFPSSSSSQWGGSLLIVCSEASHCN